jgi:ATP-dependent DNA helicase RecG
MTRSEVEHIVAEGESETVEWKKTTGQRRRAAETVCGMLNAQGGFVLFGVTPDEEIRGQEVSDDTVQDVVRELRKIEPSIVLQPGTVPVDETRDVIVISVPGDQQHVYTYNGRPYIRQGPTTSPMPQETYRRRLLARTSRAERWEARAAHKLGIDDLDHGEITRTVEEAIRRGRMDEPGSRDPEDLLRGMRLLESGQITNAAVVLFGNADALLPHYPQCLLRMARFKGETKSEFIDNRQEYGHAFDLFQRAQRFLRDHLPVAGRVIPNVYEREDDPLYPPTALREALANALCHRSYTTEGSSVGVAIYDDRLEITSSGPLPEGISVEDLTRPHASQPRNELIAGVFHRRGIIEQWGTGTLKMAEATEEAGLPPPEFEERGGEVVVRFRPTRYVPPSRTTHDLSPLQRELLSVLGNAGPMALSDIIEMVDPDVTERTIQRNLKTLRELSMVRLDGHGRGARWMIPEDA